MSTEKTVAEQIAAAFEEFKTEHRRQLEEVKKGINDPLQEQKLKAITDRLDQLQAQKDEIEKKLNRPSLADDKAAADVVVETKSFNDYRRSFATGQVADISADQYKDYKSAFWKVARKGNAEMLSDVERKALQAGVDSDGGYLLPTPTVGRIVSRIFEMSPIRAIANVMTISTAALEGILDNDEASYGWVTETGTRSETNTPTVGKYRVEAHEMYAAPKATQTVLDDAAVDVEGWLAGKQADKFARVEAAAFINGTGVGQPRGFATYTTAATADATRTWGQLEHVVTGASADFHTTTADPLFTLIAAFKSGYLQGASWVTTREVIAKIRKFKTTTTNEYLWQPGLQLGQPSTLLGYPIVIAQDMPALASGSLSMALGNFKEGYQIVDRQGIRTLRDPYTSKPYVIFYSTKRVGGAVLNFEAIKFIKFST